MTHSEALKLALDALGKWSSGRDMDAVELNDLIAKLEAALEQPERTLTDEVIADLWHANGGFHHHFARAVERWLRGEK